METMDDKAVLVDTNVLLSATAPRRPLHSAALRLLNDWPNQGIVLAVSTQILREYLVVATRPAEVNGLGLEIGEALANINAFRARMRLLEKTERSWDRLQALVSQHGFRGKQIHDANLIAVCLTSGIRKVATANSQDFSRLAEEVEVIDLASV